MITYHLDDILKMVQITQYSCSESTINCLNELETLVGAPNYVRTPKFENLKWESFRNFKTTKIKETDINKIDQYKMDLRELLNKLTTKTYENIKVKIIALLNDFDDNVMKELCPVIFQISSSNAFFSCEYSKLFKELIALYPIILTLFKSNFANYLNVFKEIEYVSPDSDYDMYCKMNKINENRRALSSFFANLMVIGVVPKVNLLKIILILQQKITLYANDNIDNEPIIEEIVENVCLIMNIIYKSLEPENSQSKIIIQNMKWLIENNKKYKSINSKTVFKYMDILDNLNISY